MKYELLSVIIPIYNAEKTLQWCLDSVLNQTYRNIEVICVNDGSTDATSNICEKYAIMDSRVKVIHKKNGGVATARNEGMKYISGNYVTFIDQDDWLEKNAYEKMMRYAMEENADLVVCSYSKDTESVIKSMRNKIKIHNPITDKNLMIQYAFERENYRGYAAFVWNKVFKTEIIRNQEILFDTALKRGDDVLFYSQFASAANKAIFVDDNLYHYMQREDSITHQKDKNNLHQLSDILIGYKKAISFLEENGINVNAIFYLKCFYVYHASLLYEIAEKENLTQEMSAYRENIKLYLKEYFEMNGKDYERINRINQMLY